MKKIFTLLLLFTGLQCLSQDLIITEISYNGPESGTDSTEFVELYNNSSASIDLSGYTFTSGVTHTFYSGESIAAGAYYVVAVDSMAIFHTFGYLPSAEFSGGLSNSGEAVVIANAMGVTQDSVDYDDGSPWPTAADGNGPSIVFCDLVLDNSAGANWTESTTNAGIVVNGSTVFGSPGADDMACSGAATLDTIAIISSADMSVFDNVGTITVTVTLNQAATMTQTVDLALISGNPAVLGNYTTQSISFAPGSVSETVTITVTPGMLGSTSEIFDFQINNPSVNLMLGADVDFELTVNQMPASATPCTNLFFSEYIEGTSNNKALEIYNPTTSVIDLSTYEIRRYNNGSTSVTSTFNLSGNLVPGDVYVIANSQADSVILSEADITSGICSFNGDDALELYDTIAMAVIDVIGNIGEDPASGGWTAGTGATNNSTIVRMSSVDAGATVWYGLGENEWDGYATNDFSFLGSHTNTGCSAAITLTAYPLVNDTIGCIGDTLLFTHTSFGGTAPYNAGWMINGSTYLGDSVEYVITAGGTISATLNIADAGMATDNATIMANGYNAPDATVTLTSDTICMSDTAYITSNSSASLIHNYMTASTGGSLNFDVNSGIANFSSLNSGTFNIDHTVTDVNGCSSNENFDIEVLTTADASFSPLMDICALDSLQLNHMDTTGTWSGAGVVDQGNGTGYFISTSGMYGITYTIGGTCGDSFTDSIEVFSSPSASFTSSGTNVVSFTNTSTGAVSYSWDFGDGNTSTAQNPTHTYTSNAVYPVYLTVTSVNGCEDVALLDVTVTGLSIDENNVSFQMYPNPSNGMVTIKTEKNATIQIFNLIGEVVMETNVIKQSEVNLNDLSKGTYFVKITQDGNISTQKLILQ